MLAPPDPDAALMLRAKDGDLNAFEQLVQKYQQPILNLLTRMVGDATEAEDLAQTVFVRAFQSAARYRASAKFSTWLYTIARHLCLNEIRRRSRHRALSMESSQTDSEECSPLQFEDARVFNPTQAALHAELEAKIQQALDELPDRQRLAVLLCRQDELSYEEYGGGARPFPFRHEIADPSRPRDAEGEA